MSTLVAPPAAAPPARAARWVGVPRRGDPRVPFALIMTTYAVMGSLWLGFNRRPSQILLTVVLGCALDMGLHWLLRQRVLLVPLSAYITSLSLALLLNYAHDHVLLALPVFLAIGSKYLVTHHGRHVVNPSLFGVAMTLLLFGDLISTAPAYQWGGTWAVSAFIVTAALALFLFKVGRGWLVVTFLVSYAAQTALRAWVLRHHIPPEMLFLGTLSSPPFYLFVFFMLTDPKTSPSTRRGQVGVALAITGVDLWFHTIGSVFTFFYAAFSVGATRFVLLHLRDLVVQRPSRYARRHLVPVARPAAALLVIALAGGGLYTTVLRPHVAAAAPGWRLEEATALPIVMDPATLDLVDPDLRHIAKWLLSVGSAVAVGDVDGDGLQDLFLTTPLARAQDRNTLWRNRGDLRFERVPLPALDALSADPATHGVSSGALLVDVDADDAPDLLLLVSFGPPRLLLNRLAEGQGFVDATQGSGLPEHAVSVAANALDYDRDGHVDLVIGNVLDPYLDGYDAPTPLNIFALPEPAFPGDRRRFRFMHDGWHDAANGGRSVLLRGRGDGTFEDVDAGTLGMAETHWTIAIGTGDLNGDGWTDLYMANDFGPDDLYLNERGRAFRRVQGRWFGDVGRDTYKGMSSSLADFDRDGRLDVYVSNVHHALQAEGSMLWLNRGADGDGTPRLRDRAAALGALNPHRFGWGAGVGDLDNDGWVDIVQANGMVDDRLDRRYGSCPDYWYVNHKLMQSGPEIHTYADQWGDLRGRCIYGNELPRVYLNRGAGGRLGFTDVAETVGLDRGENARGAALADLDGDGRLDVVLTNQHAGPMLLRNAGEAGGWIGLDLAGGGAGCTGAALGSTVTVRVPGEAPHVREVQAVNGFAAQNDPRVHVGLGVHAPARVDVSVRWCGGETATYRVATGRYHQLRR